uniref:tetrahydrofolate synthase n=1 Tax=Cyprinodon variegatus TaxID=28743 RepID=A0A3Q2EIH4_CYPVA
RTLGRQRGQHKAEHLQVERFLQTRALTCISLDRSLRTAMASSGCRTVNAGTSPHLVQVRERIRINGQPISKDLFTKYFWQVYGRLDETKVRTLLSEFVDLAVIEVGIGGAYDCTNIIRWGSLSHLKAPGPMGLIHRQTLTLVAVLAGGPGSAGSPLLRRSPGRKEESSRCVCSGCNSLTDTEKPDYSTQVPLNPLMCFSGAVVRVLLFNATGERDSAAMLKLLVPCHFDFAVFCPNITEAVASCNADQQNFNVSVENMLTRCLDNERSWRLHSDRRDQEVLPLLIEDSLPLLTERKTDTLVFPCILSALQWITQGRDPVLTDPAQTALPVKPSISARAAPLRDAAEIHVLVTGSLHLVGGVLKHLDPEGTAALNSA